MHAIYIYRVAGNRQTCSMGSPRSGTRGLSRVTAGLIRLCLIGLTVVFHTPLIPNVQEYRSRPVSLKCSLRPRVLVVRRWVIKQARPSYDCGDSVDRSS